MLSLYIAHIFLLFISALFLDNILHISAQDFHSNNCTALYFYSYISCILHYFSGGFYAYIVHFGYFRKSYQVQAQRMTVRVFLLLSNVKIGQI